MPGRFAVKFFSENFSPFLISVLATRLFLATGKFFASDSVGFFEPLPIDNSISLIDIIISLNSFGSRDALWSGPGSVLSRVKCFSIIVAPIATAAREILKPNVWSEYPTLILKLSKIVFEDTEKLKLLNSIIHPAVAKDFKLFLNSNNEDYIVKEAAIIFETKSENSYDKIIFIQAPLEIRIERVINRDNISREEVMKRINNQLDENLIIDKCDYVIRNENIEDLEDKVLSIHLDLKA